jgi:hypothetical protein
MAARPIRAATPTTWSTTSASRASARWSGWRGEDGDETGAAKPNPDQLKRYIENGGFSQPDRARAAPISSTPIAAYLDWAIEKGIAQSGRAHDLQLYLEPLRKFRLAAKGHRIASRPSHRARIERISTRCLLVSALRGRDGGRTASRCTPSRSARCTCIIPGARRTRGSGRSTARTALYPSRSLRSHRVGDRRLGLVTSHIGRNARCG